MGDIAAKFGASLTGFWWSLDEHERRILLLTGAWFCVLGLELASRKLRARERQWLVAQTIEELDRRGR